MFQYRQVLVRLRQGDSDRDIARSRLMGRPKVAAFRALAAQQGWPAPEAALPEDAALSVAVGQARRARSTISTAEPYRAQVERWVAEGVGGIAIHAALCREQLVRQRIEGARDNSNVYGSNARFARRSAVRYKGGHQTLNRPPVHAGVLARCFQFLSHLLFGVIMTPIPELAPHFKQLRLSGILDSLETRNRRAIDAKLPYTEFLALLIQD